MNRSCHCREEQKKGRVQVWELLNFEEVYNWRFIQSANSILLLFLSSLFSDSERPFYFIHMTEHQPIKPRWCDMDDVHVYQCGGLRMFVSGVEENQVVV